MFPRSGPRAGATLTVSVNPAGLAAGIYKGTASGNIRFLGCGTHRYFYRRRAVLTRHSIAHHNQPCAVYWANYCPAHRPKFHFIRLSGWPDRIVVSEMLQVNPFCDSRMRSCGARGRPPQALPGLLFRLDRADPATERQATAWLRTTVLLRDLEQLRWPGLARAKPQLYHLSTARHRHRSLGPSG